MQIQQSFKGTAGNPLRQCLLFGFGKCFVALYFHDLYYTTYFDKIQPNKEKNSKKIQPATQTVGNKSFILEVTLILFFQIFFQEIINQREYKEEQTPACESCKRNNRMHCTVIKIHKQSKKRFYKRENFPNKYVYCKKYRNGAPNTVKSHVVCCKHRKAYNSGDTWNNAAGRLKAFADFFIFFIVPHIIVGSYCKYKTEHRKDKFAYEFRGSFQNKT